MKLTGGQEVATAKSVQQALAIIGGVVAEVQALVDAGTHGYACDRAGPQAELRL